MKDTDIDSGSEKQDLFKTTAEVTEVSRNESISPMNDTDNYPMNDTDINDDSDTENLAREIAENTGEEDDGSPRRVSVNFANEVVGKKFWISAKVDKRVVSFFIDTGSDVSIIPRKLLDERAKLIPLKRPLELSGFKDDKTTMVKERTLVHAYFAPGLLKASFYVLDVPHPIIGSDLLDNEELMLSLSTGNRVFQCGVYKYNARKTIK